MKTMKGTSERWVGKRFGMLVVTKVLPDRKAECVCDCGKKTIVYRNNITRQNTTSCGCRWVEEVANRGIHGHTKGGSVSKLYRAWVNMKTRCYNERSSSYSYYGARGIKVCDRWLNNFENFVNDIGEPPTNKHTIDRIDSNGNYEPKNCRWLIHKEQCNNRRSNIFINAFGESKRPDEWISDSRCVVDIETIRSRRCKGWDGERIITQKKRRRA